MIFFVEILGNGQTLTSQVQRSKFRSEFLNFETLDGMARLANIEFDQINIETHYYFLLLS